LFFHDFTPFNWLELIGRAWLLSLTHDDADCVVWSFKTNATMLVLFTLIQQDECGEADCFDKSVRGWIF